MSTESCVQAAGGGAGLVERRDRAIELQFVNLAQQSAHRRAGRDAGFEEMTALQKRRRRRVLDTEMSRPFNEPVFRVWSCRVSGGQRAGFRCAIEQINFNPPRESAEIAIGDLLATVIKFARALLLAHQRRDLRAHIVARKRVESEPFQHSHSLRNRRAMHGECWLIIGGVCYNRFSEIVRERREHHREAFCFGEVAREQRRFIQRALGVGEGVICLRFVGSITDERAQFGKQLLERANFERHIKPD